MEKLKSDYVELVKKHEILQERVKEVKQEADESYSNSLDMNFSLDRLEQYSRKSSIRLLNVKEDKGENVEEKIIRRLKDEINVDICPEEIDIAHRVGRAYENKPRSILVKFISHKSKEKVMRRKKEAKSVRIYEDLVPGVKKLFDHVSSQRRFLNVESVWTIDGRIRYRLINNPRINEIRSHTDFNDLINTQQ